MAARAGLLAAACALAAAGLASPARAGEPVVDLEGSWFVLVHYQDQNHHPDRKRWEDKVWVFERKRSRMKWSEYPIVVFGDKSGRFESLGGSGASRVLGFWEPNEKQQADIADGLEVNERGKIGKSLKQDEAGDWHSPGGARSASASIVSYVQNWSVENLDSLPVFQREDVLGSGETEGMQGVTRYTTTEVLPGPVLVGSYERDGTRHGTFRMMRAGGTENVKGSGLTQGQRAVQIPGALGRGEDAEPEP